MRVPRVFRPPRPVLSYVDAGGRRVDAAGARLGAGRYGQVYRMRNRLDQQIRAVKQNCDKSLVELKVLGALAAHDHVVRYFGCRRVRGRTWIVLELCGDGATVDPRRDGPHRALVVRDAAAGLAHLHVNHIIHRDVKPGNLLLTAPLARGGRVKVGDFGHATTVATAYVPSSSRHGQGHCAYRSPEELRGEPYGPEADCFSLGVVALELFVAAAADKIVGNSDLAGYGRTVAGWAQTDMGRETLEDLAADAAFADGLPLGTHRLLHADRGLRPTAAAVARGRSRSWDLGADPPDDVPRPRTA